MKKKLILLCAILMLLLVGCKTVEPAAESEPYKLTVSPGDQNQCFFRTDFVETPDGYYYGNESITGSVNLIYFCPRGGTAFRPLCSKPNCLHNDRNCNAWYDISFGYYNGALYTINYDGLRNSTNLVKIDLDDNEHQVVASVDESTLQSGARYIFHHGKLFIQGYADMNLPLDEQKDHLIVLDLSDYSQKELAADYLCETRIPNFSWYCKDKLYGMGTENYSLNYTRADMTLIELDAVTGECRSPIPGYVTGLYVTDSTWYFFEPDLHALDSQCEKSEAGFREYDPKTGTVKDCGMPVEDIQSVCYDEDYVYARGFSSEIYGDRTLYFLSRDYKLVDRFEMTDGLMLAAVTSDRVYFAPYTSGFITCYLDKAQIGSGELTLVPIETK